MLRHIPRQKSRIEIVGLAGAEPDHQGDLLALVEVFLRRSRLHPAAQRYYYNVSQGGGPL